MDNYNHAKVKEILERGQKNRKLTNEALSAKLRESGLDKVSAPLVSHWRNQNRRVSNDAARALAAVLDLSVNEKRALYEATGTPIKDGEITRPVNPYLSSVRQILENKFPLLASDSLLKEKLLSIVDSVVSDWRGKADRLPPWAPSRGPDHNFEMLRRIAEYLNDEEISHLTLNEQFLLIASIWLHDIGIAFAGEGVSQHVIHETFHSESWKRIKAHHFEYQLNDREADVIVNLCKHYRDVTQLSNLEIIDTSSAVIAARQRLLLAYLQLADILDARPTRLANKHYFATATQSEVVSSWLFNLFIQEFGRDRDAHKLVARVNYSPSWGHSKIADLISTITKHLQGRLNHLKDILIAEGRCTLLSVEIRLGAGPDTDHNTRMVQFLSTLGTFRSPNARRVFQTLLDSMGRIGTYAALKDFAENRIPAAIKIHPYHARVRNLQDQITGILTSPDPEAKKLDISRKLAEDYVEQLTEMDKKIGALLTEELDSNSCVVLMGYSDCVFNALKEQSEEIRANIHVVVLECRNKSVYDLDNALEYCDGAENAVAITGAGFRNVWLATDASVASLFHTESTLSKRVAATSSKRVPRRPTAVLLGINTIEGCDGYSTAGYLTVTTVAKANDIPVYVLTETGKIRKQTVPAQEEMRSPTANPTDQPEASSSRSERPNRWLAEDDLVGTKLKRANVELFNPLDDLIPGADIRYFLTEEGRFTPSELKKFADTPSRGRLAKGAGSLQS
jgi:translation initiation factor 2B subunit (eIF-2B alpha/beta/delta family)